MLSDVSADHKIQQEIIAKPFEKADELAAKRARFNEVMVVYANYRNPVIRTIFKFNDTNESNMSLAKELIKDAEGNPTRHRDALQTIENTYGHGYATQYNGEDYRSDAWKNRRTERADSSSDTSGTEQHQQRTEALTDREILSLAANELSTSNTLTDGERAALEILQTRLT